MPDYSARETAAEYFSISPEKARSIKRISRKKYLNYKLLLFSIDILMSCFAYGFAAWLSGYHLEMQADLSRSIHLFIFALITISFFFTYNLYSYHRIFSRKIHLINLNKSFLWGCLTIASIVFLYKWPQVFNSMYFVPALFFFAIVILLLSRIIYEQLLNILRVLGISFLTSGIFSLMDPENVPAIITNELTIPLGFIFGVFMLIVGRFFLVHIIFNVWMRKQFRQQVLIIGSNIEAEKISNHVIRFNAPFYIRGVVGPKPGKGLHTKIPKSCLGELKNLPDILHENDIDEIILTDESITKPLLISLLDFCTSVGITVWFPPKLMPIIDIKLYIDDFCGIQMIRLNTDKNMWVFNKFKHALDALITLPIFIILLPVFAVISIAIKLESKGPVFYKARAIGKNAKEFFMYKFRSMYAAISHEVHKEYVSKLIKGEIKNGDQDKAEALKITDDPRITSVGKVLRKLSLDELPQLINVLKGEMSLVGPRPCLPYEYEIYQDWHKKRTVVRPGITGLWQVAGRSAVAFDDMILLDLYYIYNRNLSMDFNTLYETLFVVLKRKGAY